jgi:hypothetical protein
MAGAEGLNGVLANNEMQARHGPDGTSLLISVLCVRGRAQRG